MNGLEAIRLPSDEALKELALRHPEDPQLTLAFCQAHTQLGRTPFLFRLHENGPRQHECLGFLTNGRWSRSLQIRVPPDVTADSSFWPNILRECRRLNVWDLELRSVYPSVAPPLPGELSRWRGFEYHLALSPSAPMIPASKGLRWNLTRARKKGLTVRRMRTTDAIADHLKVVGASQQRRVRRGEDITGRPEERFYRAMLSQGAGEFFQAVDGDRVVASIFLLRSSAGAYYQSAGSAPEGMEAGAPTFVVAEAANIVRLEGTTCLNLAAVSPTEVGLMEFKERFGGQRVPFEIVTVSTVHPLLRKLRTFARLLRYEPAGLFGAILSFGRSIVFSARPQDVSPPALIDGWTVRKLSDGELLGIAKSNLEFWPQAEAFKANGFNDAFGAFVGDEVANLSWLVTAEHDQTRSESEIRLGAGEAEITTCYTAKKFRGKGIYPNMIRALCQLAAASGVQRVYMCTLLTNLASQRGIKKAGLQPCGQVVRIGLPFLWRSKLRFRGHRWIGLLRQ